MSSDFGFGTRPHRWLFGEGFWLRGFVLLARWEPSNQVPAKLKAVLRAGANERSGALARRGQNSTASPPNARTTSTMPAVIVGAGTP